MGGTKTMGGGWNGNFRCEMGDRGVTHPLGIGVAKKETHLRRE